MSCSSYCQGLQSCLEPARLVEPRVLRLILAPPKSNTNPFSPASSSKSFIADSKSDGDSNSNNDDNVNVGGGWSFLQSLATNNINSETSKQDDSEKDKDVYTPPNFKRSSSMLNAKSLEMCTESLGSETGSDGGESSDEMALLCVENVKHETRQQRSRLGKTRRMTRTASFPPPLTSISGSTNVQVKSHREGGRLVLEAVSVSPSQTYFHAERIDGRLRLHLMKDGSDDEQEQNEEAETLVEAEDGDWEEAENGGNCGGEMGMERLSRPSRCKESDSGNKSLINWEPFWVAT